MKKIFTLFAAVIGGLALNAKTLYLNPGVWEEAGAKFALYYFNPGSDGVWSSDYMSQNGSVYQGELPDGYSKVIFVRLDPNKGINWDAKWNQTDDLDVPSDKDQYNITGWGTSDGNWSVYGEGGGDQPGEGGGDQPGEGGDDRPNEYWYWKGYVDGGDITNEEGGFNIFVGGKSEVSFEQGGYLFVMHQITGIPGTQYMATSYVDGPTHATMTTSGSEKLHVPAGDHTLYLYDNEDGTVELSFEELPGKKLMGGGETDPGTDPGDDKALDENEVSNNTHKFFQNGQLYILRGEKIFDATGRQL